MELPGPLKLKKEKMFVPKNIIIFQERDYLAPQNSKLFLPQKT